MEDFDKIILGEKYFLTKNGNYNMNLNQISCFLAVADTLNFTEASKRLYMVQSAVSHNISELEKELNFPLFYRDRKSVALTDMGKLFLPKAKEIQLVLEETEVLTTRIGEGILGTVKIGYLSAQDMHAYRHTFLEYHMKNPMIDVVFNPFDIETLFHKLKTKQLDLIIANKNLLQLDAAMQACTIHEESFCLMVQKSYQLPEMIPEGYLEQMELPLVLPKTERDPSAYNEIMEIAIREGAKADVHNTSKDIFTVMLTVAAGEGYTIMPQSWNWDEDEIDSCQLEGYYRNLSLIWNKGSENLAAKHLKDFFVERHGIDENCSDAENDKK